MAVVTDDDSRSRSRGELVEGVITRLHSRHALVRAQERTVRCTLRKKLFHHTVTLTQPLAVGDRVRATFFGDANGVVEELLDASFAHGARVSPVRRVCQSGPIRAR